VGLRFFSDELLNDDRFIRVNTTRKCEALTVRASPESLGEIWLPSSHKLLRLPNVSSDSLLIQQGTLTDQISHMDAEALYRDVHQQDADQASMETTLDHQATTAGARREQKAYARSTSRPQSKHAQKADLRKHAADEQKLADALAAKQLDATTPCLSQEKQEKPVSPTTLDQSSCNAMAAFLASLNP